MSRLVGITGPARGSAFPLVEGENGIGRDPENAVVVSDPMVSPRHGVVACRGRSVTVAAVGARNAIFVNGLPVGAVPRQLTPGDEISIGGSIFLFSHPEVSSEGRVGFVHDAAGVHAVYELGCDMALGLAGNLDAAALGTADIASLLKVGTVVSTVHGLVALRVPLMNLLLEAVPADRVALVMTGDAHTEIQTMSGCDRVSGPAAGVRVERSLVERALRERVGVLARRGPWGARREETVGLRGQILVAPMVAFDRVLGALYLDMDDDPGRLTPGHLVLVHLTASVAAMALDNARHIERLERENRALQAELAVEHDMVGDSVVMRALYQQIARVAPTDATVLIRGESGTGKELIARAVHRNSPRASGRFVAVNCAALAETLLESELFGHEKGAFTGAVAQKKGRLEFADGGTVFLDEIGELPVALQAKLLRALQEREFERVGGTRPVRVDVRLIAATNRDLEQAMAAGAFRRDLYYRLNVISLRVPPLRERREDIAPLARHFARRYGTSIRHAPLDLSPAAIERLRMYDWPGNVRELENAIERAVVLGTTETLGPADFAEICGDAAGARTDDGAPLSPAANLAFHEAILEMKKGLVLQALERADGNFTAAARLLSLHPNYLHRLIRNLDLRTTIRGGPNR
jgi:transcriptional regulator with GAF, ATPase, and Fis domain